MTRPQQAIPDQPVKACCAATYSSDLVSMLLGDSYHPGGISLTRRLASAVGLSGGQRVLDVAAGRGTTALMLAGSLDVLVDGVDLSSGNVALAKGAAADAGVAERARFHTADAERLPFGDGTFDAVVCECAFCLFPDKTTAATELARVLRPGGRLGLTDVVADTAGLPAELTSMASWVACIADARPAAGYVEILEAAGLQVRRAERHDSAMTRMVEQIRARLDVLRMTAKAKVETLGLDFDAAQPLLDAADAAVAHGTLGYVLMVAEKPG
jgi:arsenite methyltransferase